MERCRSMDAWSGNCGCRTWVWTTGGRPEVKQGNRGGPSTAYSATRSECPVRRLIPPELWQGRLRRPVRRRQKRRLLKQITPSPCGPQSPRALCRDSSELATLVRINFALSLVPACVAEDGKEAAGLLYVNWPVPGVTPFAAENRVQECDRSRQALQQTFPIDRI